MKTKILFVDRDGTLIREPEDKQVDAVEKVALVDDVIPALLRIQQAGYKLVIVSNQDGLGTPSFPEDQFRAAHEHMLQLFSSQGIRFSETLICPHFASDNCHCRKPATGLLTKLLAKTSLDTGASAFVGDRDADMLLAERLGITGFRIGDGVEENWLHVADAVCSANRKATIERRTRETQLTILINLDSQRQSTIQTGIGFFDHMLEQIAKHADVLLDISAQGDLHVDEHHLVEDTAIGLGQAMREALGNKIGIGRYGFVLPMDESEAAVSLDLSGRGAFVFDGEFSRQAVGDISTEMVVHFFQSFAEALGAALHIKVTGRNTHHMIEACFKAVGRALRPAIRIENTAMPSTKGMLA